MFKNFLKNFKAYIDYLMTVEFKELFLNVGVLFCIIMLSLFTFFPVSIIQDLVKSIILTIINAFEGSQGDIFNIVFYVIGIVLSFISFMYLFNMRFEDLEAFKDQVKKNKSNSKSKKDNDKKDDDLDLPKEKDNK